MNPLLQFVSWQFMLFSLLVGGLVFFMRLTLETFIKGLKDNFYWTEYFLVIIPLLLGGALGFFVKSYPYPDGLSSAWSRVIFGFVAGQFSGWLYRVVKSLLSQTISGIVPVAAPPPPPPPVVAPPPVQVSVSVPMQTAPQPVNPAAPPPPVPSP